MCAAHRRQVLAQVRQRLDQGEPCLLATTQLVEAGVDLDFPLVLRAMGPLERIVQAAGRCNREGKLPEGRVIVFEPIDGGMPPGSYRTAADVASALWEEHPDLDLNDPVVHELYFSRLYGVTELDARHIAELRRRFDFPAVAEAYKIIPDDTVAVAIPWAEGEALLNALEQSGHATRDDLRRLQPYFVNLVRRDHERARAEGLVREVLRGSGLWRWEGGYDHVHLGLHWQDSTPACI
jgi:CRISPR-associated endonuclease/helicase Cas3